LIGKWRDLIIILESFWCLIIYISIMIFCSGWLLFQARKYTKVHVARARRVRSVAAAGDAWSWPRAIYEFSPPYSILPLRSTRHRGSWLRVIIRSSRYLSVVMQQSAHRVRSTLGVPCEVPRVRRSVISA